MPRFFAASDAAPLALSSALPAMRAFRNTVPALVMILIAALAIRVGAAVAWDAREGGRFHFGDSESYWILAGHIARGERYQYGGPDAKVFRTPGYPLLLAPLFVIYGEKPPVLAARILGAVLGTATVYGVFLLGRQLASDAVGLLAAAMMAVYPGAIGQSIFVLSEAPFCAVMVFELLVTWLAWRAVRVGPCLGWGALAGALAGAATLIRPSWLLFAPLVALVRVFVARRPADCIAFGGLVVGLLLAMTPWCVRNERVTGHLVLTTLQVGASLYDGLNPRATGASDLAVTDEIARFERRRADLDRRFDVEYRLDQRLREEARDWAVSNPGRVAQLAAIKFFRLWNVWPNESDFRSWPLRIVTFATYVPLMGLALWGTWRLSRDGALSLAAIVLCWLPAVYFTALHVVFVSSLRYREPAMLTLAVVAAAAVVMPRAPSSRQASLAGGAP